KAVESLGKISPKSKTVIPALLEALKEVNGDVRHFAVETLGSLGSEAKSAMPALIEMLTDRDADIQLQAVAALVRIDPKAKEVVRNVAAAALKKIEDGTELENRLK